MSKKRNTIIHAMLTIGFVLNIYGDAKCESYSTHYGIDIDSPVGSDVRASDSGTVVSITPFKRGENQITIITRTGGECIYVYVKPLVVVGQDVIVGTVIGVTDASAPTVRGMFHYAYRDEPGGVLVDPEQHLPPRAKE